MREVGVRLGRLEGVVEGAGGVDCFLKSILIDLRNSHRVSTWTPRGHHLS